MTAPAPAATSWRRWLGTLRAQKRGRWLVDVLVVIVVIATVGAWQTRDLHSGKVPAFTLPTLAGGTLSSAQLAGTPTLLVFWAPWCGVCRLESQNLSWLQSLVGARAKVVSIAVQYDQLSEVHAYVREREVDYPVLLGGRDMARTFGVRGYPTLFFLDAHGQIKRSAVGYTTTLGLFWRLLL